MDVAESMTLMDSSDKWIFLGGKRIVSNLNLTRLARVSKVGRCRGTRNYSRLFCSADVVSENSREFEASRKQAGGDL